MRLWRTIKEKYAKMESIEMNIVYASDENYFPYVYVSIKTLLENNRKIDKLQIHYIYQNVSICNLQFLKELGEIYDRTINLIEYRMPSEYERMPSCGKSKTTYAKFLFGSIFPDKMRVLYIDPDTLVFEGIEELFQINMGECVIGGVLENLPKYHRDVCGLSDDQYYINGGIVLMNLDLWRKMDYERMALQMIATTDQKRNHDQGIINDLCKGRVMVLPPKYNALAELFELKYEKKIVLRYEFKNYYSQEEVDEAIENPVIVHFTNFLYGKPICRDCDHPMAHKFQELLLASPLDIQLSDKKITPRMGIRKFILRNLPFSIYLWYEKIADVRRMKNAKRSW